MTSWTIRTYEKVNSNLYEKYFLYKISYNIQYNDMYDKVLFYISGVDLTNEFHGNHEQIDIFQHIYIDLSLDMNDIIQFCNVVMLFY